MPTLTGNIKWDYHVGEFTAFQERNADLGISKENTITLDSLRYQSLSKSVTKSKCNLAASHPERSAVRQHSFQTTKFKENRLEVSSARAAMETSVKTAGSGEEDGDDDDGENEDLTVAKLLAHEVEKNGGGETFARKYCYQ
ncbi:hypothetical protein JTB14_018495 [Gonioctena quinquepunctata]|nr:hypothetical protein JTB14_018495 [Gonioctena quinquepunctata]